MLTLYGIKNCDKCRAARKVLAAKSVAHIFHDIRADGITKADIKRWLTRTDMDTLLNKRGTTWRNLPDGDKAKTSATDLIALMEAQPTLMKRPICEADDVLCVGWSKEIETQIIQSQ